MTGETEQSRFPEPRRFKSSNVWLGNSAMTILSIVSWVEIFAIALAVALLYPGLPVRAHTPVRPPIVGWHILRIDGNRAREEVLFDHAGHVKRIGDSEEACRTCHHMSAPGSGPTSCWICHRDMYESASMFAHKSHQQALGGNRSCNECHIGTKAGENAKPCKECHPEYRNYTGSFVALSYEDAMHSLCVGCHRIEDRKAGRKMLSRCELCHMGMDDGE